MKSGGSCCCFNSFASIVGEWCIVLAEEPIRREEGKAGVAEGDDEGECDGRRRFPAESSVSTAAFAPSDGGVAFVRKVHHLRRYRSRR